MKRIERTHSNQGNTVLPKPGLCSIVLCTLTKKMQFYLCEITADAKNDAKIRIIAKSDDIVKRHTSRYNDNALIHVTRCMLKMGQFFYINMNWRASESRHYRV